MISINAVDIRFDDFIAYLKNTKHSSENTVSSYVRDMHTFEAKMEIKSDKDYCKISPKAAQAYFSYLTEVGKSASSVAHARSTVNCYFTYLIRTGKAEKNPIKDISLPKETRKTPLILTTDEVDRLLSAPDLNTTLGIRDKAMLELMYATGLKVTELIDLDLTDVNTQIGFLKRHNNKKDDIIPLYSDAINALNAYIGTIRDCMVSFGDEDALFINHSGKRLSRQGCWKIIKQYTEKADIKKDITPQILRHSLAIHLLQNGAELKDVQEILGHSEISSTRFYAQIFKNQSKDKLKKFHPRAN